MELIYFCLTKGDQGRKGGDQGRSKEEQGRKREIKRMQRRAVEIKEEKEIVNITKKLFDSRFITVFLCSYVFEN